MEAEAGILVNEESCTFRIPTHVASKRDARFDNREV
jgi:hypothetical protein